MPSRTRCVRQCVRAHALLVEALFKEQKDRCNRDEDQQDAHDQADYSQGAPFSRQKEDGTQDHDQQPEQRGQKGKSQHVCLRARF